MSSPQVYEHPINSSTLLQALKAYLPYSIALYYRIQHTNQSPHAHILATFPPSTDEIADTQIPSHFAAAYIDRSTRPETELLVFSTNESPDHAPGPDGVTNIMDLTTPEKTETNKTIELCSTCRTDYLALLSYIKTLPLPPLNPENQQYQQLAEAHAKQHPDLHSIRSLPLAPGAYLRQLLLPSVVTFGTVHSSLASIAHTEGYLRDEFPGTDTPLHKFIFRIADLPEVKPLPEGLHAGPLRPSDIAIVQSRTAIPRATRTLLSMKSVGIFESSTDRPVAWTFLGLDGALSSLHTEPEFRGRGLAKAVAARCLRKHAAGVTRDGAGEAWGHADVYKGNVQSEGVCGSLGGKKMWTTFWVRLDLERVVG